VGNGVRRRGFKGRPGAVEQSGHQVSSFECDYLCRMRVSHALVCLCVDLAFGVRH